MAVYETGSRAETAALGERLAKVLRSGSLVLFTGGLGAGKTAFCEGIARGLGCTDENRIQIWNGLIIGKTSV